MSTAISIADWVPVQRLPKSNWDLLLALANGSFAIGFYDHESAFWRDQSVDRISIEVTHWARLPPAPLKERR